MKRRTFVGSSAAVAAGAALGLWETAKVKAKKKAAKKAAPKKAAKKKAAK